MSNVFNYPFYLVMFSLFLFSCSSSSNSSEDGENGEDISGIPIERLMGEDISFMFVTLEEYEEDLDAYVMLNIIEDHENTSLKINGNPVQLENWFGFYFSELEITPAQDMNFELEIDDNSYSGSLTMPGMLHAAFPSNFDLESNYSYSWEIDQDPASFVAWLDMDTDEEWVEKADVLPGNTRSHTFESSVYSHLSEDDLWYVDVGVSAIDYDVRENIVFIASFDKYHEYDFDSGFSFKKKDQRGSRFFQMIQQAGR